MGIENDIMIAIGAKQAGSFQQALKQSESDLKRFVADVEKQTGRSMETINRRVARSVGTSSVGVRGEYIRDMKAMWQRDMFPTAPGMGQGPMVEPGRISSEAARNIDSVSVSLGGLAKGAAVAAGAIEAASLLVKIAKRDWMGAAEVLKRLPFGLGRVTSELEGILGELTGITGQIEKLKELEKERVLEGEAVANNMKRKYRDDAAVLGHQQAASLAMASEQDRPFLQLEFEHKARMKASHSDRERLAILQRYNAERIALIRQQTDREMAEEDRRFMQERDAAEKRHNEALERERKFVEQLNADDARRREAEKRADEQRKAERAAAAREEAAAMIRPASDSVHSRFLTRMPGSSVNVSTAWDKNEKRLDGIKNEARRTNTLLDRLIQVTRERGMGGGQQIAIYAGA